MPISKDKTHFSIESSRDVHAICLPLFQCTDINYMRYIRIYDDGLYATLLSNGTWLEHIINSEFSLYVKNPFEHEPNSVWLPTSYLVPARLDSSMRSILDMSDSLVIKYKYDGFYELYIFGLQSNQKHPTSYYLQNTQPLENFIMCFKEKANNLLHRACLPKNRIEMPGFLNTNDSAENHQGMDKGEYSNFLPIGRYFFEKNGLQGHLTPREWGCLRHIIRNYSARQIAEQLNLSPKTIETYIASIRVKLECRTYQEIRDTANQIFPSSLLYDE